MSPFIDALALWLADVHLLAGALLAIVLLLLISLRQPARRMAAARSTLAALFALAVLCALPGWSLVHLLSAEESPSVRAIERIDDLPVEQSATTLIPTINADQAPAVDLSGGQSIAALREHANVERPEPMAWSAMLVMAHLAGSTFVCVWLASGGLYARRLRGAARPAPPDLADALKSLVGGSAVPELLLSDAVPTPVALGMRRPAIILPAAVAGQPIAPILAHEWAHIRHGDLGGLAAGRLLLVLLWPQPLYWLLRRNMRFDQETLADAAAAEHSGRFDYAQQLLGWARTASTAPIPRLAAAVGLWEGPSQLKRRVALLVDEQLTVLRECTRRWRVGTACAALIAAGALSLVTLQRQETVAAAIQPETAENTAEASAAPTTLTTADANQTPTEKLGNDGPLTMMGFRVRSDAQPNVFSGRCLDENNQPLSGVKVSLYRGPVRSHTKDHLGDAETNIEGEFRFDSVVDAETPLPSRRLGGSAPDEPILLCVVTSPGRVSRHATAQILDFVHLGRAVDFVMPPGAALRGRVTDANGRPIAGAIVSQQTAFAATEGIWSARTNDAGEYVIDDLAPFDFEAEQKRQELERVARAASQVALFVSTSPLFRVTHPDFGFEYLPVSAIPGRADVTLKPGGRIAGRVTYDDGQPAADAEVRAVTSVPKRLTNYGFPMFDHSAIDVRDVYDNSARTDADGRYEFSALRTGQLDVWVEAPGWFNRGHGELEVKSGQTSSADIRLVRGGRIRAQLVDAVSGQPIEPDGKLEAVISLYYADQLSRTQVNQEIVTVDDEGVIAVQTRPGKAWMIIHHMFAEGVRRWQPMTANDYILRTAAAEVVDGKSVDVEVKVTSLMPAATGGGVSGRESAAADADATRAAVEETGQPVPAAWAQPAPNVVNGRVVDEAGQPLAQIEVSLYRYLMGVEDDKSELAATTRSDAEGLFRFANVVDVAREFPEGLPDENFPQRPIRVLAVVAQAPGRATAWNNSMASSVARSGHVHQLQLPPAASLRGRVTGPDGLAVAGALVFPGLGANRNLGTHVTRTDAQGRYEVIDLAPFDAEEARKARDQIAARAQSLQARGPVATVTVAEGNTLIVEHPDFAVRRVSIERIPGEIDVQLEPGAVVEGRIVLDPPGDGADGKPAVGADVALVRDVPPASGPDAFRTHEFYSARVRTDAAGRYSVRSLPAGKYNVSVSLEGWTTLGGVAEATAGQTTQAPDVVMTRGGAVRLQLVDAESGKPIAFAEPTRAYVNPVRKPDLPLGVFPLLPNVVTFSTSAAGEFNLPPGDYAFLVHQPARNYATDPSWQSTNIETIRTEPTHAVVEGETIEINVPMKQQTPPTGAAGAYQLVPATAIPAAAPAEPGADSGGD